MSFLSNFNDLFSAFQQIAIDSVENSKPLALVFGCVSSVEPFSVLVEQKLSLSSSQLLFLDNCLCEEKSFLVGDKLALLRQQGGQKFLVLDRVVIL